MPSSALNDVYTIAKTLSREDIIRLRDMLTHHIGAEARAIFRPGDKVQFKLRNGQPITGTVVGIGPKNIKVEAKVDRYGFERTSPVTWTVSPQLLTAAE